VAGHRQPDRIDVTADDIGGRIPQRRKLGADRTGRVVHDQAGQPPRPVRRDRFRRGLLQRLVSEQPIRRVDEFSCGLSPQQRRLHQHGGAISETVTRRSDVGH
jgi:hypothetical protein